MHWFCRLAAYNDFAKRFNCQVYLPDHLYWKQDLELEDGVVLRVHGLTSTFLSGAQGEDDTRENLYLSPLQTVLDPVEDVVNLVLCHHPPDWLLDQDDADDAICGRGSDPYVRPQASATDHARTGLCAFQCRRGKPGPERAAMATGLQSGRCACDWLGSGADVDD